MIANIITCALSIAGLSLALFFVIWQILFGGNQ